MPDLSATTPTQTGKPASLKDIANSLMISKVPAYGNTFFYSLGFLSMTSFVMLIVTGIVMVASGPNWWLTTDVGSYVRSLHLWSTQAFVVFIMLHLLVVFLTSGFKKPRRLTWVFGALMFFFALVEAEFGYGIRSDFSSQWRALQASDLYNGSGLGVLINNLNYAQIYGIHIIVIPFLIMALLFCHYLLVKVRGIAKPYRPDVPYRVVPANHTTLFLRGGVVIAAIAILAAVFPSPLIIATSVRSVATSDSGLIAKTLLDEWNRASDTATYSDTIDPYAFDTKAVYIDAPYAQFHAVHGGEDAMAAFAKMDAVTQKENLDAAATYFSGTFTVAQAETSENPVVAIVGGLLNMAQTGLYEAAVRQEAMAPDDRTYVTRFLADTGVLEDSAKERGITTDQYGMVREEKGEAPGAWWLSPLGLLDNTVLANDDNQDRDGAEILGILFLLLIAFPFIPGLNRLPEKLGVATLLWRDKGATAKKA